MTEKAISPLRQRLIEDMTIRRLSPKTRHDYIRHVKSFADFLGRSPDKATAEDVRRYQLRLASTGATVPTVNVSATALRFFFKVTLKRSDLADELVSAREPRRLPVVLSPEEVSRLLTSATNIKHKAVLSLAYATGMRASEVVSLKLTDIDRERMVIRVEQGKGKKDRYVMLSPNLLELLRDWWRAARKKGWMDPGQPWPSPATAGIIRVGANSTASFASQRDAPASPNASAFIRCGTALPRISWSKRPIFASSRCCSDTRNSTRRRSTRASPSRRSAR
jgi:integrase/recombinase XerD